MTQLSTTEPIDLGDIGVAGLLVVLLVWLAYAGILGMRLAIASMQRHWAPILDQHAIRPPYVGFDAEPARDMTDVMDSLREAPTEPAWRGKVTFDEPANTGSVPGVVLHLDRPDVLDLSAYAGRAGDLVLPATPAETSQPRHARIDPDEAPTGLMASVLDGNEAMAVVAAVSGQDGPS